MIKPFFRILLLLWFFTSGVTVDAQKLHNEGYDGNTRNLLIYTEKGNFESVKLIVGWGADIDFQRESDGNTALILAAKGRYEDIIRLLMDKKANPRLRNKRGETAGDYIQKTGTKQLGILFNAYQAYYRPDVQAARRKALKGEWRMMSTAKLESTLQRAIAQEDGEVYFDFLKNGGNPNWMFENGTTPLIAATVLRKKHMVSILLQNGANPMERDKSGKTAIDRALDNEILDLLVQYKNKRVAPNQAKTPSNTQAKTPLQTLARTPVDSEAKTNKGNAPSGARTATTRQATAPTTKQPTWKWPPFGALKAGDSVILVRDRKIYRGVVHSLGMPYESNNRNREPSETKYFIKFPDTRNLVTANWCEVVAATASPFWTEWFLGKWRVYELKTEASYEKDSPQRQTKHEPLADDILIINPDYTYSWTPSGGKEITGIWKAADGPGIMIQKGKFSVDWVIRNESSYARKHRSGTEIIRLYPQQQMKGVVSVGASRPVRIR